MLELKRKKLEFKLDDKVHILNWPSVGQLGEFQKVHKEDPENVEHIVKFMSGLGGKEKLFREMDSDHLGLIVEEFFKKKN